MEPKILLLDIETQPDLVYTWGVYEQNAIAVKEHWQLLSYSAEWVKSKRNVTKGLVDYKDYKPGSTDYELVKEIWDLLDEAEIVVAHNGADFDLRKLNARFIYHKLKPPSPYKIVDTKREVSRVAGFSSNKLDWLCKQLELGAKLEHEGVQLWLNCMAGNRRAWAKMKKYNRHDVTLLRELYLLLAPWIRQPNANIYTDSGEPICPNPTCMSTHLIRQGWARNKSRKYQRYKCQACGTWSRDVRSHSGTGVVPV